MGTDMQKLQERFVSLCGCEFPFVGESYPHFDETKFEKLLKSMDEFISIKRLTYKNKQDKGASGIDGLATLSSDEFMPEALEDLRLAVSKAIVLIDSCFDTLEERENSCTPFLDAGGILSMIQNQLAASNS